MSRFLIGVEIERQETAQIVIEVEANSLQEAKHLAEARAQALSMRELDKATSRLDWEMTGGFDVGSAVEEYDAKDFDCDFPLDVAPVSR